MEQKNISPSLVVEKRMTLMIYEDKLDCSLYLDRYLNKKNYIDNEPLTFDDADLSNPQKIL